MIVINGTAEAMSTFAVGSHQLIAVFTPTAPAVYGPLASPPMRFVVTASSGTTATSATLTTSPVSPVPQDTQVVLTATVTPVAAVGTVQFKDGTPISATR